jgi:hypothetical protein
MKIVSIFCLTITFWTPIFSQENFIPSKPDNVSESDYRNGEQILKNSYQQISEDDFRIVASDYWNFATAYYKMGQPKEMVYDYLFKARYTDRKSFCQIVNYYHKNKNGLDSTGFYKLLGEDYRMLVSDCATIESEEVFNIDEYIEKNRYDKSLIYKLNDILQEDQKRRQWKNEDLKKQREIDDINIIRAEEIIMKYGYPGTKMVGAKFDFVIWIVIQHSTLPFQEKHLSLIAKAVEEKQIGKTSLRMLLDRIYSKKTGFQLFGSQVGVPFSDDRTIEEIKLKYKL